MNSKIEILSPLEDLIKIKKYQLLFNREDLIERLIIDYNQLLHA